MHMKNLNADLKDGMTDLKNEISHPEDDIAHLDDYNPVHLFLLLSIVVAFTRFTCVLL